MKTDRPGGPLNQVGRCTNIVRLTQRGVFASLPLICKDRVAHNMQGMQLDPVNPCLQHPFQTLPVVRFVLARQTQDQVTADRQVARPGRPRGRNVLGHAMTPINALQGLVEGRLQTQFKPHLVTSGTVVGQQVEDGLGHAIWPCPDRKTDHPRQGQRRIVKSAQGLHIGIGVGVGLKIGQIFARARALGDGLFCPRHLGLQRDRQARTANPPPRTGEDRGDARRTATGNSRVSGIKGLVVAKGAATDSLAAITIGTGKTSVDGDLVHPLAMTGQQVLAEGMHAITEGHQRAPIPATNRSTPNRPGPRQTRAGPRGRPSHHSDSPARAGWPR